MIFCLCVFEKLICYQCVPLSI